MHPHGVDSPAVRRALRSALAAHSQTGDASSAMASFVDLTRAVPLVRLEDWEQAISVALLHRQRDVDPSGLRARALHDVPPWLALCSGNGYQREAAIRALAGGAPNALFFALLLRRMNDWVSNVRCAARDVLPRVAARSDPHHVAEALWVVFRSWITWGRMTPAERDVLLGLVDLEPIALALKSRIIRATVGPAPQLLSQFLRSLVFVPWLREFSRDAVQPAVRAKAFRWLLAGQAVWVVRTEWVWTDKTWCKGRFEPVFESRSIPIEEPFHETLERAIADRSAMVRGVAVEFLIRNLHTLGERAQPFGERLAADADAAVARRGRYAMKMLMSAT